MKKQKEAPKKAAKKEAPAKKTAARKEVVKKEKKTAPPKVKSDKLIGEKKQRKAAPDNSTLSDEIKKKIKPFKHPEYKWIPEGKYAVTAEGQVYHRGKEVKYHQDKSGIVFIRISGENRDTSMTRAYMTLCTHKSFPPAPGYKAHHIDGNLSNDNISNLDWRTSKEISMMQMQNKANFDRVSRMGKANAKLTAKEREFAEKLIQKGEHVDKIAEKLNHKVKASTLNNIKYALRRQEEAEAAPAKKEKKKK